jgi:type I restriction enzyme, S subunit
VTQFTEKTLHYHPRYVFFYSISPFLQQETQKYVNKTTQPNVGIKSIQQFLFPLPPLAEQERIVKRVEQLLSLCDALEARLQSAEEERGRLVRAVMAGVGG